MAVEYQAQPLARVGLRRLPGDGATGQRHAAARRLDEAGDGAHQRGLARSVSPKHEHDLARAHAEVDTAQHRHTAVACIKIAYLKHPACR